MNKQEIVATKAELCEVLDTLKMVNEKIDLMDKKIDSLIHAVNVIDFVRVDATSNFAKSKFKQPDLLGWLESEVPEVTEQTLSVSRYEGSMACA